ncbi:MAG: hypothetical protein ABW022_11595 [Actinoplanes sp.]
MAKLLPDARLRLARHLFISANTASSWAERHWDFGGDQHVNRQPWLEKADTILNLITEES